MKRILGVFFAAAIVACGLSAGTYGQDMHQNRNINQRERRQQRRIVRGVRRGQLNARETYRLERQQSRIRRNELRYRRSGGGLSHSERARLRRQLNRTSRHIYRQKHDRQETRRP